MHSGKQFIQGMFKAGAYGYLLKDGDSDELITAITTVVQNKKYLSKDINQEFLSLLKKGKLLEKTYLSSREKEVLQLIAEGKSSKKIGEILFLSSKTIDVHRNNIMKKYSHFDYFFPLRIDFILVDERLTVNNFKSYPLKYSDHYPIMARINIPH